MGAWQYIPIRLYLPRYLEAQEDFSEIVAMTASVGGNEQILLVDDDDLVRSYVHNQLERMGYRVTVASSGPAALEIIQQQQEIDLLFTDVVIPGGMSGGSRWAASPNDCDPISEFSTPRAIQSRRSCTMDGCSE
ncbi:MAG: response regulator [Leptolyngbya sp. DLM2.Bin27]|nr:MAG: response regulator [Leptolyngbya sp. DLM2.Bin27]